MHSLSKFKTPRKYTLQMCTFYICFDSVKMNTVIANSITMQALAPSHDTHIYPARNKAVIHKRIAAFTQASVFIAQPYSMSLGMLSKI